MLGPYRWMCHRPGGGERAQQARRTATCPSCPETMVCKGWEYHGYTDGAPLFPEISSQSRREYHTKFAQQAPTRGVEQNFMPGTRWRSGTKTAPRCWLAIMMTSRDGTVTRGPHHTCCLTFRSNTIAKAKAKKLCPRRIGPRRKGQAVCGSEPSQRGAARWLYTGKNCRLDLA